MATNCVPTIRPRLFPRRTKPKQNAITIIHQQTAYSSRQCSAILRLQVLVGGLWGREPDAGADAIRLKLKRFCGIRRWVRAQ